MISKQFRASCPECPPGITFFEDETSIFELDLHGAHQRGDEESSYIVRWRVKKETLFINMQRYEEEVLTSYYTDVLQEPSLTQKPHQVDADYTYKVGDEKGYHLKHLHCFLIFGRTVASALDLWDILIQVIHGAFVDRNESSISFADHNIRGGLEFILQIYSDPRPESGDFKEICFIVQNRYFPQKVFAALLQETFMFPISKESAEEIVRLAEAEQRAFFNHTT